MHICDKGQIKDIAEEIPESAKKVIDNFMPGPVTIILKKKSVVPKMLRQDLILLQYVFRYMKRLRNL